MKLTAFTDYGLRALILLADRKPDIMSTTAIADHFNVSRHHMAKVLQALATAGFVEGIRGAQGGARLAQDPRDIRIGDVMRTLDNQALVNALASRRAIARFCRSVVSRACSRAPRMDFYESLIALPSAIASIRRPKSLAAAWRAIIGKINTD